MLNNFTKYLPVVMVSSAIALLVTYPVQDFDIFWHIANGRAMVENGRIVNEEIFSYTSLGKHFNNHAWLAQIIFYLFFSAFGANGLICFKVLITLSITAFIYKISRTYGLTTIAASILSLFAIWTSLFRFVVRPHLFSYLFLIITAYILFSVRDKKHPYKILIIIPIIMLLWDFMHGAIYGLILLCAFMTGESIKFLLPVNLYLQGSAPLDKKGFKNLWICFGSTMILMLISPYGLLSYDIFFEFINKNLMTSMTAEFLPPTLAGQPFFWVLLLFTTTIILFTGRMLDITSLLVLVPFSILATKYVRGIGAFSIIAAVLLAVNLPVFLNGVPLLKRNTILQQTLMTLILSMSLIYAGYYKFFANEKYDSFGFGLSKDSFPVGSVAFIKSAGLTGNMYNTDRYGGYLAYFAYPERKIFHYNHHMLFDALERFVHEPETRSKWNINYAIIGRSDEWDMFAKDGFIPVYWEPSGAVMLKNNTANQPIIKKYKIRYFSPLFDEAKILSLARNPNILPALIKETANYLSFRHDLPMADSLGKIALMPQQTIPPQSLEDLFIEPLKHNGNSAYLLAASGIASYQNKNLAKAKTDLQKALAINKNLMEARFNLAYVLFDQGLFQDAVDNFEQVLAINNDHPASLYGLALSHFRMNNITKASTIWQKFLKIEPTGPWSDNARNFLQQIKQ